MNKSNASLSEEQIDILCEAISFCLAKNNNSLHEKLATSLQKLLDGQNSLREDISHKDERVMELLVSRSVYPSMAREGVLPRARAIESLRGFIGDARKITICDPYLFALGNRSPDDAMADIENILPRKFDQIDLFVLPSKHSKPEQPLASGDSEFAKMFTKYCQERNAKIRLYLTQNIHDRIWIKHDRRNSKACLLGTSLNGLGNKISFILGLPKKDLEDFESELSRIRQSEALNYIAAR